MIATARSKRSPVVDILATTLNERSEKEQCSACRVVNLTVVPTLDRTVDACY